MSVTHHSVVLKQTGHGNETTFPAPQPAPAPKAAETPSPAAASGEPPIGGACRGDTAGTPVGPKAKSVKHQHNHVKDKATGAMGAKGHWLL